MDQPEFFCNPLLYFKVLEIPLGDPPTYGCTCEKLVSQARPPPASFVAGPPSKVHCDASRNGLGPCQVIGLGNGLRV